MYVGHIIINDKIFRVGDRLQYEGGYSDESCLPVGAIVTIAAIRNENDGDNISIGLEGPVEICKSWHNLDGNLSDSNKNRGWWFRPSFHKYFRQLPIEFIVTSGYKYKNNDLSGKKCKSLLALRDKMLVEFEEMVGGSSGDGLGRRGHCLVIEEKYLEENVKKKSKNKEII